MNQNEGDEPHTNRYYTSTMQWSECIPNATGNTNTTNVPLSPNHNNNHDEHGGVVAMPPPAMPVLPHAPLPQPQQQQQQQQPPPPQQLMESALWTGAAAAPTIKNHSVTHFGRYLYCFGGYDGRRNHTTLLIYDCAGHRWVRPIHYPDIHSHHHQHHNNNSISSNTSSPNGSHLEVSTTDAIVTHYHHQPTMIEGNMMMPDQMNPMYHLQQQQPLASPPTSMASHGDDRNADYRNGLPTSNSHNPYLPNLIMDHHHSDTIIVQGTPPPGRNGHSATLAVDQENHSDAEHAQIVIIGGWLGTGPLAASDTHILDVSCHGKLLRWYQPTVQGTPPGPCNMHSADYVTPRREVYVFRGGNGREYLNDLHALHVPTVTWRKVNTTGQVPQQRANHSSAMLEETSELFIFGGWNGTERLNDIHLLDTKTSTWTFPKIFGILPHPRAGMTLTALRGRLYLFGGSGQLAKCFYDLQIFDRASMTWLDVSQSDHDNSDENNSTNGGNNNNNTNNTNNNASIPNHRAHFTQSHHHHHHYNEPQFTFGGNQHYRNSQGWHNSTHNTTSIFGYQDDTPVLEPQQAGGTQEGGNNSSSSIHRNNHMNTNDPNTMMTLPDWRSREHHNHHQQQHHHHRMLAQPHISPNPNDEDTVPSVLVHGHGPARRAGHTATAVGRKIYIFGGSYGSKYLNDFYILDTDPPPQSVVTEPNSLQLIERRLRHFFNDEEFADVTFIVQGQKVYGHKMILSIVSECFRAMFTTGFRESDEHEIEIPDCTYTAFVAVMEYIYTGTLPSSFFDIVLNNNSMTNHMHTGDMHQLQFRDRVSAQLIRVVEVLELADRFFLDHLKQICESHLQNAVTMETVEYLLPVAQKTNSSQLQSICEHLIRNK